MALTVQLGDELVHTGRAKMVHRGRAELVHPGRVETLKVGCVRWIYHASSNQTPHL